jgi:hypothetical protein
VLALDPIKVKDSGNVAAKPKPVITQARTSSSGVNQIISRPARVNEVITTAISESDLNFLNNREARNPEGTPTKVVRPRRLPASRAGIPLSISSDGSQFRIE